MGFYIKKSKVFEAEQFLGPEHKLPFADKHACNLGPDGWYVAYDYLIYLEEGDWVIPVENNNGFYRIKKDIFSKDFVAFDPKDSDQIFILFGKDPAAKAAIFAWCEERIKLGLNKFDDDQLVKAREIANGTV